MILRSLDAVLLELSRIFLVELFSVKGDQTLDACTDDERRYAQFKTAQKVLNKEMMAQERQLSSSKALEKYSVLDSMSPG